MKDLTIKCLTCTNISNRAVAWCTKEHPHKIIVAFLPNYFGILKYVTNDNEDIKIVIANNQQWYIPNKYLYIQDEESLYIYKDFGIKIKCNVKVIGCQSEITSNNILKLCTKHLCE